MEDIWLNIESLLFDNFGVYIVGIIVLFFVGKAVIAARKKKKRDEKLKSLPTIHSFVPNMMGDLTSAILFMQRNADVLVEFKALVNNISYEPELSIHDPRRLAEVVHAYKHIHFKSPSVEFLSGKHNKYKWITSIILHEMAHIASGSGDESHPDFQKHYDFTLSAMGIKAYKL